MDRTEELDEIRRQLETLATSRLGSGLRPHDEERYRELCARELELLRT